jgi:hypothetical protein
MKVSKKEMLKEHKHLVKVLRSSSSEARKREASKQAKEMKKYK